MSKTTVSATILAAGLAVAALAGGAAAVRGDGTPDRTSSAAPAAPAAPDPGIEPDAEALAATPPGFIAGTDLPPHPTERWTAGPVTAGLPKHGRFCLPADIPAENAWHRDYWTGMDTSAGQISWRTGSAAAGRDLLAGLERAAANCAPDWLRNMPGGTAGWQEHGAVGRTGHAWAVYTSIPESEPGIHMFGVGRDGGVVTVVHWGQMGDLDDAPATRFKGTTRAALDKLR